MTESTELHNKIMMGLSGVRLPLRVRAKVRVGAWMMRTWSLGGVLTGSVRNPVF